MKKLLFICLLILANAIGFSQSFNSQRMDSLFEVLKRNNKFMGSITVSMSSKLLYSNTIGYSEIETFKKANTNTKYRIGSISKMFTALLIFKAVEENKISLNQTLDKYFPQIVNSKEITIENLLNHKSGIHDLTHSQNFLTYNTTTQSETQMINIIAKGKSDFKPDSKVEYSNSNYVVLSYILEKIYKKPYGTILNTKIVKPLGLKNTYFGGKINIQNEESHSYHFTNKWEKATETDASIPMGAGAIVSNTTDLSEFIRQLFKGKIISLKSLAMMRTMNEYHGIGIGMGMLSFTYFGKKSYGHNGAIDDFQSILSYSPDEKLSVAVTSNGSNYSIDSVLVCALSSYYYKAFEMPTFVAIQLKPEILDMYLGQYASEIIPIKMAITKKENQLFGQVTGQPAFLLEATATNTFKFEPAGIVLEFDANKKQMILKQGGREILFTKE